MTKFVAGQAVERITPTRHVRGRVYPVEGRPDRVVMEIEQIVSGTFMHIENPEALQAYDPHLVQLDAAEADSVEDDILQSIGVSIAFTPGLSPAVRAKAINAAIAGLRDENKRLKEALALFRPAQ